MKHILKCQACGKYTFQETCCSQATVSTKPPKYSPDDKFAGYRRKAKKEMWEKKGLL